MREAPAKAADHFSTPKPYIFNTKLDLGLSALNGLDKRAGLLDTDGLINNAYDAYVFLRNPWLQRRDYQVRDGKVPPDEEIKEYTDPSLDKPLDR